MSDRDPPPEIRVESRSETRGDERPIAVWIGRDRFDIVETLDRAMISGVEGGAPTRHRLWVKLHDGSCWELVRVLPDGTWQATAKGS